MHWRTLVAFSLLVTMAACVQLPNPLGTQIDMDLLNGEALFGYEVAPAPAEDVLALSPAMHEFLAQGITDSEIAYSRFRQLMRGLQDGGYFANSYEQYGTHSAAQTFADGKGNCLGYTNMFIALARAARLDARYQMIDSDPNWNVENGYLVKNNHINVVVKDVRLTRLYNNEVIVDFNLVRPDPEYSTARVVSDEYAAALFYANIGVDYLHEGRFEEAFAQLKRGVLTEPKNKTVWTNLGVLLSKMERPELAQRAYEQVMRLDRTDKTAWVGMAVALTAQGRHEEASVYSKKVEYYQTRNPFYHYALAEAAFKRQQFDVALDAVETAINIKRREPSFWSLQAAAATELGNLELAARSEKLAARYRNPRARNPGATAVYRYD